MLENVHSINGIGAMYGVKHINIPVYFLYNRFWVMNRGRGNKSWGQEKKTEEEEEEAQRNRMDWHFHLSSS